MTVINLAQNWADYIGSRAEVEGGGAPSAPPSLSHYSNHCSSVK